jgi:hypothetical protein
MGSVKRLRLLEAPEEVRQVLAQLPDGHVEEIMADDE